MTQKLPRSVWKRLSTSVTTKEKIQDKTTITHEFPIGRKAVNKETEIAEVLDEEKNSHGWESHLLQVS